MGVSMNPIVNKKVLFASLCLYLVFEPGWDLGDTSRPGNLALWFEAGPFTGCKRTCWLKVNLRLTAR